MNPPGFGSCYIRHSGLILPTLRAWLIGCLSSFTSGVGSQVSDDSISTIISLPMEIGWSRGWREKCIQAVS